jgi:hypothetical protein
MQPFRNCLIQRAQISVAAQSFRVNFVINLAKKERGDRAGLPVP